MSPNGRENGSTPRTRCLLHAGMEAIGPFRTNSLGMEFAWIPRGTFRMGSPILEHCHVADEIPHHVTLTKGFFPPADIRLTAQVQWRQLAKNVSAIKGNQLPVTNISWNDCSQFCQLLSGNDGITYRLPSEAEWEYACRGGSSGGLCYGLDPMMLRDYAWYTRNSGDRLQPVGLKHPNPFGLYDIHGNVWEWCSDWYGEYPQADVTDPRGPIFWGRPGECAAESWNSEWSGFSFRVPLSLWPGPFQHGTLGVPTRLFRFGLKRRLRNR